ncbi:DUF305 domain-containing protein [Actinomadura sp. GTD37]|uniref:DUF305 domain-containing protein n=1 Tax=Actinomadura sp. GTD37 TaxID=1778030 RepID=UPI0035C04CA3
MNWRRGAGRFFPAAGFMVIGAAAAMLLSGTGRAPDEARAATPGSADIGFGQDMIVHHQQAVTMVQTAGGRLSPPVAQLATGIELNQLKEIGQMQGWLSLWNAPQVSSGPPMTWMTGDPHHGHHGHGAAKGSAVMPGMASVGEIRRLGEVKGADADAWFLKLMIRHHEGGLLMTTAAVQRTTLPQVRSAATLMTAAQRRETATMLGLLSAMGERPLPSPASG